MSRLSFRNQPRYWSDAFTRGSIKHDGKLTLRYGTYAQPHHDECRIFVFVLNAINMSIVMLNVIAHDETCRV
jgi:hypothetical protein